MKNKNKVISVVVFLSVFILLVSCQKQNAEWKGKVEIEDGIRVIKNPVEPLFGEIQFELEEDLSIGNESSDNFLFYQVVDIEVDLDGNIYVLESENCRIQKFDKYGNYVLTIGRQGQGPGEFESPYKLFFNERIGNICVRDRRRIDLFDNNGNYLDRIIFQSFPMSFAFDSDGNIWGIFSKVGKKGASSSISMANSQGKLLKEVIDFPIGSSSSSSGGLEFHIIHGYEYDLLFSELNMQTFVYAYSKDYELNVFNKGGELLYKIRKDEPPLSFSSDIKNKIRERYISLPKSVKDSIRFPDSFPFFDAIFADDEGRIYVKRVQTAIVDASIYEYDIFSKDGYYLYNTKFLKIPRIIKNGFFYIFEADNETGIESAKRYKIKNWDQIKKEK